MDCLIIEMEEFIGHKWVKQKFFYAISTNQSKYHTFINGQICKNRLEIVMCHVGGSSL